MWKSIVLLVVSFCLAGPLGSQALADYLLPRPQRIQYASDTLSWGSGVVDADSLYDAWNGRGTSLPSRLHISLVSTLSGVPLNQDEAYAMQVSETGVSVQAVTSTGVYRALQTLEQLAISDGTSCQLPACDIVDWPAFRIRGFMQDVGRTYLSMDELKREIDLLSRFKVNVFHWHLTENQAWRLESKRYPALNAPENMTRMPGLYYTLQEARELVDYCKRRHVLLIPEIDMPGHSEAFRRTFGTDMQSQEGMAILKELLEEACDAFDVPYIHIGTDEVGFTNPDFVPQMVAFVRSKGKKVVSWNPGWNYQPGEVDMTQLWSYRGKAQEGIPAIDCRFHYVNHYDLFADLVALYHSRVYDAPQGSEDLAGVMLAFWNDRYVEGEARLLRENNFYAHMLAMAERSWLGGGTGYFNGKCTLLREDTPESNRAFADFERRLLWHKHHTLADVPVPYVRQTQVKWRITDAFPNGGDLSRVFPPEQGDSTSYVYEGRRYGSRVVAGAGVYLRHVWGTLVPGFYEHPQENHTAYAVTWVYSPREQPAGLLLEFQNYSRSESDLPPLQGKWDYKESRAWLNGVTLSPPVWENVHRQRSNEVPLANENCVSRPPLQVTLHEGWNKLLLKLPVGRFQTPEVRLVKWMFTAMFVTPDGRDELDGLVYSADKPVR